MRCEPPVRSPTFASGLPEIDAARARLALELRLASSQPSRPTALLSSVVVTFVKAGDEWQAIEEPILLAS